MGQEGEAIFARTRPKPKPHRRTSTAAQSESLRLSAKLLCPCCLREPLNRSNLRRYSRAPLLEAIPAKHRSSLCRPERDRGFFAALRTDGKGFGSRRTALTATACSKIRNPLRFATLTPFGLVPELLVVEKHLFPGGKNKIRPAVDALQHLVLKLH